MKKNLLRLLITILILFFLLLVGLYFAFSSPYFIKSYLFPALTNATGVRISADEIYLSNFSTEIKLKNYLIGVNQNVVVDGEFASFKYDFWSLLKGKINISNLVLTKARVNIRSEDEKIKLKKAHKLTNKDKEIVKNRTDSTFEVNIKNTVIKNSELQYTHIASNTKKSINLSLNDINILIPELGTNKSSNVDFNFSFDLKNQDYYKIEADSVKGNLRFTTENWNFLNLELSAYFDKISGINKSDNFDNKNLALDLEVNSNSVNYTVDRFMLTDLSENNQSLLDVNLKGEVSLDPFNVVTEVLELKVSSKILNILGSFWELNFGQTDIDYTGNFDYTDSGFGFEGNLKLDNLSFSRSRFNCLGNHIINLNILGDFRYSFSNESFKTDKLKLVINEKNNDILTLKIDDPINLSCNNGNPIFFNIEPSDIDLKAEGFDLSILENIFCRYFSIQLLEGSLNTNLNLKLQSTNEILLKGDIDISKSGAVYNKLRFKKIDLKQSFDLLINSFNKIFINRLETTVIANSDEALKFRTDGMIDFLHDKGDLRIKLDKVKGKGVNNLSRALAEMLAIKDVKINGFIDYSYNQGGKNFSIKSMIKGEGLKFFLKKNSPFIPILSGDMELDITKSGSELNFKKSIYNLYMPNEKLGNLAADGKIILYGAGKSKLNLYSEGIRLEELIKTFNSLAGSFNINFDDMRFDTKLVLENIVYGPYLTFDCEAGINFGNGVINADPILLILNTKPILGKIVYNFKAKHDNYFNFAVNTSNIEIKPILQTFDPLVYSNSNGVISNFSMNVEGKGFSRNNLKKNLKGDLSVICRDVSLPDNPENNNYVKLLFIPIEVISQMNELFGDVNLPVFLNNLVKYSQDIFNQMINLDLKYGVICATAQNGKIIFKHIVFKGNSNPISWLKFKGELGLDETVHVTSKMKLNNYLIVPLHISGTLKNPKPNMMSLYKFVEKSAVGAVENDFMDLVELPEEIFEKLCYESDILFQSVVP